MQFWSSILEPPHWALLLRLMPRLRMPTASMIEPLGSLKDAVRL